MQRLLPKILLCVLLLLHLGLVRHSRVPGLLPDSLLLWSGICIVIMPQRIQTSPRWSTSNKYGLLVLVVTLIGCCLWWKEEIFLRLYPMFVGTASTLIMLCWSSKLSYCKRLLLLFLFMLPTHSYVEKIDFFVLPTAWMSRIMLEMFSLPVIQQGAQIWVEPIPDPFNILTACASFVAIRRSIALTILFVIYLSLKRKPAILLLLFVLAYTFFSNCIRIVLLSALKVMGASQIFEYWHLGVGATILPLLMLLPLFGILFYIFERVQRYRFTQYDT
jgi:exosortase/archaeosortase family protein